jgi:hypothetical protein
MNLSEVIIELRELNEPVPKPFRLPTEAEVLAAEKRLNVRFHEDYRRFLLEASDVARSNPRWSPPTAVIWICATLPNTRGTKWNCL